MRARLPIPDAERAHVVRFALSFAGLVVGWACLHDVYLINVEPRHFTEYHRPLLPIRHHALLAMQYAVVATLGPGLVFGFLAWIGCRAGRRAPISLGRACLGFAVVMVMVEGLLMGAAAIARVRIASGQPPLYPEWAYPDLSSGIQISQTVNISAYLIAPATGALYLFSLFLLRRRSSSAVRMEIRSRNAARPTDRPGGA